MATANESNGLKIAVALLITLSVILAVTSYFLYSSLSTAEAKLELERNTHERNSRAADQALRQYDEMRTRIGTKAQDFDPAMKEISAHFAKVEERLDGLINVVDTAVQRAEQNGAQGPELDNVKLNIQRTIASFRSQPNKNYITSLDQMTDAVESLSLLTTQLSLKYVGVKKSLEEAASLSKGQKDRAPKTKE